MQTQSGSLFDGTTSAPFVFTSLPPFSSPANATAENFPSTPLPVSVSAFTVPACEATERAFTAGCDSIGSGRIKHKVRARVARKERTSDGYPIPPVSATFAMFDPSIASVPVVAVHATSSLEFQQSSLGSEATTELKGLDEPQANSYEQWGGLAAAVASCDDFERLRSSDPDVWTLLSKLDLLHRAGNTAQDVLNAWQQCAFTPHDMNRLNSPLLDGIWYAINLTSPGEDHFVFTVLPNNLSEMCMRLIQAEHRVYLDALRYFLKREPLNVYSWFDALFCSMHRPEVVEFCLQNGASLEFQSYTLLVEAVRKGSAKTMQILMLYGLEIDRPSLVMAAASGKLDMLQVMLASKAGSTNISELLHAAIANDRDAVTAFLLDRGATLGSNGNLSLFDTALLSGSDAVLRLLFNRRIPFAHSGDTSTAFLRAASSGYAEAIRVVLENGYDYEVIINSATSVAVRHGRSSVLAVFLEHRKLVQHRYLLTLACDLNDVACARLILNHATNVQKERDLAMVAIATSATPPEKLELLALLIDRGADVNVENGRAILQLAKSWNQDVAKLLLRGRPERRFVLEMIIQALDHKDSGQTTDPPPVLEFLQSFSEQAFSSTDALALLDAVRARPRDVSVCASLLEPLFALWNLPSSSTNGALQLLSDGLESKLA